MNKIDRKRPAAYDADLALWAAEQGALLRSGKIDQVDLQHVAEEIESLGRSDKYEIDSRLEVLIQHLLKWQFQPSKRSNSWRASIHEQRIKIGRVLKDSPSLKAYPQQTVAGSFTIGLDAAIRETGLSETTFPKTCPYSVEEILDETFWPGAGK